MVMAFRRRCGYGAGRLGRPDAWICIRSRSLYRSIPVHKVAAALGALEAHPMLETPREGRRGPGGLPLWIVWEPAPGVARVGKVVDVHPAAARVEFSEVRPDGGYSARFVTDRWIQLTELRPYTTPGGGTRRAMNPRPPRAGRPWLSSSPGRPPSALDATSGAFFLAPGTQESGHGRKGCTFRARSIQRRKLRKLLRDNDLWRRPLM